MAGARAERREGRILREKRERDMRALKRLAGGRLVQCGKQKRDGTCMEPKRVWLLAQNGCMHVTLGKGL